METDPQQPMSDRFVMLDGVRVPAELSLVGCDDIEMARLVTPELTTVAADSTCSRHGHTRFALVMPGGPSTLVALDGCAVQQDDGWWRATDRLRALVGA